MEANQLALKAGAIRDEEQSSRKGTPELEVSLQQGVPARSEERWLTPDISQIGPVLSACRGAPRLPGVRLDLRTDFEPAKSHPMQSASQPVSANSIIPSQLESARSTHQSGQLEETRVQTAPGAWQLDSHFAEDLRADAAPAGHVASDTPRVGERVPEPMLGEALPRARGGCGTDPLDAHSFAWLEARGPSREERARSNSAASRPCPNRSGEGVDGSFGPEGARSKLLLQDEQAAQRAFATLQREIRRARTSPRQPRGTSKPSRQLERTLPRDGIGTNDQPSQESSSLELYVDMQCSSTQSESQQERIVESVLRGERPLSDMPVLFAAKVSSPAKRKTHHSRCSNGDARAATGEDGWQQWRIHGASGGHLIAPPEPKDRHTLQELIQKQAWELRETVPYQYVLRRVVQTTPPEAARQCFDRLAEQDATCVSIRPQSLGLRQRAFFCSAAEKLAHIVASPSGFGQLAKDKALLFALNLRQAEALKSTSGRTTCHQDTPPPSRALGCTVVAELAIGQCHTVPCTLQEAMVGSCTGITEECDGMVMPMVHILRAESHRGADSVYFPSSAVIAVFQPKRALPLYLAEYGRQRIETTKFPAPETRASLV